MLLPPAQCWSNHVSIAGRALQHHGAQFVEDPTRLEAIVGCTVDLTARLGLRAGEVSEGPGGGQRGLAIATAH